MTARPECAVVLAAGMGTRLGERGHEQPKGFLRLGTAPIIEESLAKLEAAGIRRVVIVTGHCAEWYDELAAASRGFVTTVHNARYAESGSMYSLYCARDVVAEDFLLLESDLIYERRALEEALAYPRESCVLLSGFTHSNDEVFVQSDGGVLRGMSKNANELGAIAGELVGITKVSLSLYEAMREAAEQTFDDDLRYDYETDCLVDVAQTRPVYCHLVENLAWGEIDDEAHLARAREKVYPEIQRRDAAYSER